MWMVFGALMCGIFLSLIALVLRRLVLEESAQIDSSSIFVLVQTSFSTSLHVLLQYLISPQECLIS